MKVASIRATRRRSRIVMPFGRARRGAGFSLIELLATMAVMAVLAALAAPSFTDMLARSRVRSASMQLLGLLEFARVEAATTRRQVEVAPVTGNDWNGKLRVFTGPYDWNKDRITAATILAERTVAGTLTTITREDGPNKVVQFGHIGAWGVQGNYGPNWDWSAPMVFTVRSGKAVQKVCLHGTGMARLCE